jgi:hypothetical protein
MIALDSDYLLFELANGESMPFSSDMISVELSGESSIYFDQEFVQQAAASVFHYFKHELGRDMVSVGEFAGALEKVLRGFVEKSPKGKPNPRPSISEFDLSQIATESGEGCELFFYPRLRSELHARLAESPRLVRFRGLRGCVKQLTGAQRWSQRCQRLHDSIVDFLRNCLNAETVQEQKNCALLVD